MRVQLLTCVLALGLAPPWLTSAAAEEFGVSFTGTVSFPLPAYGYPAPPHGSDLAARLVYLTESEPVHNLSGCDCGSYRQRIFNGFSANFGDFAVRADEYYIEVINDYAPDGGSDFVFIVYSSNYIPANETPLFANGAAEESGKFYIHLRNADGTAIDSAALPDPSVFSQFETRLIFLKESPVQNWFNLQGSLQAPEPLELVFGDYDFDDDVDGSDFLVWQRSVGDTSISPADGDRDGSVHGGDLAVWRQHFGESAGSLPASMTAPEPSGLAIAALLLTLGSIARFTRGHSCSGW